MRFRPSFLAAGLLTVALSLPATTNAQSPAPAPSAGAATGTWTWSQPGRNGDTAYSLKLTQAGDKVTGTLTGQGGRDSEIQDGTFKDNKLTFKVVRDMNGQSQTTTYTATITGDSFTAKAETVQSRDITATRSK